jgi:hypothetical protein
LTSLQDWGRHDPQEIINLRYRLAASCIRRRVIME